MKKSELKRTKGINKMSPKRAAESPEYYALVNKLRDLCENTSEMTGENPDWKSKFLIDPHHIDGRAGSLYLDPFNIIMLTRDEHDAEKTYKRFGRERLLREVMPIRIAQGFRQIDVLAIPDLKTYTDIKTVKERLNGKTQT